MRGYLRSWALPALALGTLCVSGCTTLASSAGAPGAGSDAIGAHFVARGNEPFWAIEANGATLRWKTPELPAGRELAAERMVHATGTSYGGDDGGKPFTLVIVHDNCSDGMSDRTYGFTATWTYDGQVMHGCAEQLGPP